MKALLKYWLELLTGALALALVATIWYFTR
jgi:hypothetical protein